MKDKQLLLAVLAQIEREQTVSIPQLAQMLGVSEERIFDTLETLVFAYDAASIRLDLHDTYASLETHGAKRLLRLTSSEADALLDALLGAGFSPEDSLVESLLRAKGMLDESTGAPLPHMQVIGVAGKAGVTQVVTEACEDEGHHLLEISYRGQDDAEAQTRAVEPACVYSQNAHRYLSAYCHKAQAWRSFRLDRIDAAHMLDEQYTPRNDTPSTDDMRDHASVQARLHLEPDCPALLWHGLKITRTREDGSKTASVGWTGSSWLPKHIVALMGKALPLEPPELIDACKKLAKDLLDGDACAK